MLNHQAVDIIIVLGLIYGVFNKNIFCTTFTFAQLNLKFAGSHP